MSPRIYKSYVFRTKDPVIDEMRTMVQDEFGSLKSKDLQRVEAAGGPKVQTMQAWFFGVTKRPNNCSVEAAGRALGKKRVWVKMK